MAQGFLDIIKRELGDGDYAGDEFGGAKGKDGSGLPTGSARNFMFATGIECSYPTIKNGKVRRDELAECGHYERWCEDFALVKDLGLRVLRYGLPYFSVHQGPGKYDWSFADEVMREMQRLEIMPILDLLHFGLPDWIGNFQNPELPILFAQYAEAVAKRYPWVRYYTPINEMYVTARASAKDGLWNEQLKTDQAFVTAVKHIVAASKLACQSIALNRPDAIMIFSESAEYTHEVAAVPSEKTKLINKLRFLSLDLLYAHPMDSDICMYLLDNGLTREEYEWMVAGEPPGYQILGMDYYGHNEKIICPDGTRFQAEDVLGWSQIARQYYDRYLKPIMHTETNVLDADLAPNWMWKQWVNVLNIRRSGVPVLGFTWYSLTDQIDWDIELAEKKGTVNACGLYDLDRKPRPVAKEFRTLLETFGQIAIIPHGELFEVTGLPAQLKTEV